MPNDIIKIKERISNKIYVAYNKGDLSVKLLKKYIRNSIKDLVKFYKISKPAINIELFYTRKEFNEKIGYKTPIWLVGFAVGNNIYLFSPSVLEKVSNHKKSDFKKVLRHEICHIFNYKLNKNPLMWVDEGIALLLAGQKKGTPTKKDLDFFLNNFFYKNIKLIDFANHNGYKISYFVTKNIRKKLGKKKLLRLIKISYKNKNSKSAFKTLISLPDKVFNIKNASLFYSL